MPSKRHIIQIGIAVSASLIIGLLFSSAHARGVVQQQPTSVQLTLLPDYSNNQVMVVGMVFSTGAIPDVEGQLGEWGLDGDMQVWSAGSENSSGTYYFQGIMESGSLGSPDESGRYIMELGPFNVPVGDTFAFAVPFTSLMLEDISPAPNNIEEIRDSSIPLTYLRYAASDDTEELVLEIPFVPIQKEIELNLFPLVGEMLQNRQDSYRLYGRVTFKGITDFVEFGKYCQPAAEDPYWPYRMADTLFSLDSLPIFHFGYLPPTFQYKPSYLLVRSELVACSFEDGSGEVVTQITGRIFTQPGAASRFPDSLGDDDPLDSNSEVIKRGGGIGIYEMQLGYLSLGPGDLLKINLPGSDVRGVSPAPARYAISDNGQTLIEFNGPGKFVLNVRYVPKPEIFIQQMPATIRAFGSRAESLLSSFAVGPKNWAPWVVLVVCMVVLSAVQRSGSGLKLWQRYVVWFAAGALIYYSFQHIYGLIFFALGVHFLTSWRARKQGYLLRDSLALLVAAGFLFLDLKARDWIFMLDGYQLELTQFTPLLLLIFGLVLYIIYRAPIHKKRWTHNEILSLGMILFAFSVLDALQKSLPAIILAGVLIYWVVERYSHLRADEQTQDILGLSDRFRVVMSSRFVWLGFLVFAIYIVSSDITSTSEVFSPTLGVIRFLLGPISLFFSVVLSFLATGGLFLLLYPLLPFKQGYLRAIIFSLALWLIFILGVGADSRLVVALPTMLVGRFVYYLSAPLLAGIFLEIHQEREKAEGEGEEDDHVDEGDIGENVFGQMVETLKNFLGPISSLISLVAPALYAWISDQPLITSYFDVLEVLIQFI